MNEPTVVTTDNIPIELIDEDALKVVRRLKRHGHTAYLVGGCVRDLLNGLEPKDFDVSTSARPRQVRRLFSNSRVIGRRFRLVHVIFGSNIIEVSTFRADPAELKAEAEAAAAAAAAAEDPDDDELDRDDEDYAVDAVAGDDDDDDDDDSDDDEDELDDDDDDDELDDDELDDSDDDDSDDDDDEDEDEDDDDSDDDDDEDEDDDSDDDDDDDSDEDEDEEDEEDDDEESDDGEDDSDEEADDEEADDDEDGSDSDEAPAKAASDDEEGERPRRSRRGRRKETSEDSEPDEFELNNVFGDPAQDARRRDFTLNALFYDPDTQEITDYTGGLPDIERKLVNPIRDPGEAFIEDPVRMIRAIRFAAKLDFRIADSALAAIAEHGHLVAECSQRRLLEEIFKILASGYAARCFELLVETKLYRSFLPEIAAWIDEPRPERAAASVGLTVATQQGAPAETGDAETEEGASEASESGAGESEADESETEAAEADESETEAAEAEESETEAEESETEAEADEAEADEAEADEAESDEAESDEVEADEAEAAGEGEQAEEPEPNPDDPSTWGPGIEIQADPPLRLYPQDDWRPDKRLEDAFLRVTWERPLPSGANDWVEDPHVYVQDSIFEAAACARDAYLERAGLGRFAGEQSERERARSVLRVLRWNGRLEEIVDSIPAERPARKRRSRRRKAAPAERAPAQPSEPVLPEDFNRLELLSSYLGALDKLTQLGVPLSNGLRTSALFAPMLMEHLETSLREDPSGVAEDKADELLFPIARRQSLARKDRDRIKRSTIVLRRLLNGEAERRSRGRDRMLARDYFREAIVLLWIHLRATEQDLDLFHRWEAMAKKVKPEEPSRRGGGRKKRRRRRRR